MWERACSRNRWASQQIDDCPPAHSIIIQQPRPILPITTHQPTAAKIHLGRLARAMVPKRLASARETRVTTPARRPRRTSAQQQRASNQRDFNQVRDHVFSSLWTGGAGGLS